MDSADIMSLYLNQLTAQTQTGQAVQTAAGEAEAATTDFADVLAALSGASGTGGAQQYLLSGLLDGSITVSNSENLVTALLSTMDSDSGLSSGLGDSLLSQDNAYSQDTLAALLDLNGSSESDWLAQYIESLKAGDAELTDEEAYQQYYQALAAITRARQDLLGG